MTDHERGEKGDTGIAGATGAAGAEGRAGAPGAEGAMGQHGVAGVAGAAGAAGAAGEKGEPGETKWLTGFRDEHAVLFIVLCMAVIVGIAVGASAWLIDRANQARIEDIQATRIDSCESGNSTRLKNLTYQIDQSISLRDGHQAIVSALQASEAQAEAVGRPVNPQSKKIVEDLIAKLTNEDADLQAQLEDSARENAALDCKRLVEDGERRTLPLPADLAAKLGTAK